MNIRVKDESEVVNDQVLRKAIIDEINGPENMARKDEAYRRNLCNKDKTKHYVLRELLKQFDDDTVREMGYSISNISIGRKIIDKIARVYSNGCTRNGKDEAETETIQKLSDCIGLNRVMKQANRYLRTHKNTMVGVIPCPVYEPNIKEQYEIKVQAYQPHLYDVIEQYYDREKPMFVILSNYKASSPIMNSTDPGARPPQQTMPKKQSDGKDQIIADKAEDNNAETDQYIWWSKYYHFTTNKDGEFINFNEPGKPVQPEDLINPIQKLNFVNFAIDQEGSFWAEGGDDVYDGSVHINCMITNTQHIGVTQGYGQFWMKGKGLPRMIKAGVNKSILLEVESKDDPDPQIGYASANPKLQELKEQIVMYVALLLTTNNLSTKAVAAELSGSSDFASGISLIIDKAESVEDVQDQRDIFYQNEPELFKLIADWQAVYKESLTDKFKQCILPQDVEAKVRFNDATPIMSEKEKLENLKLRKDLGINSMIELIMKDSPQLSEKEAEEKLLKLLEQRMVETAAQMNKPQEQPEENSEEESEEDELEPEGEMEQAGKYYEDENGDLWEKTEEGFKKVSKAEVSN